MPDYEVVIEVGTVEQLAFKVSAESDWEAEEAAEDIARQTWHHDYRVTPNQLIILSTTELDP